MSLLNRFGRIAVVGFASLNLKKWNPFSWLKTYKDLPKADIRELARGSFGIMGSHLGYVLEDIELINEIMGELRSFVEEHSIRPHIGHVLKFDEIPDAHRLMESRKSVGKIVVKM